MKWILLASLMFLYSSSRGQDDFDTALQQLINEAPINFANIRGAKIKRWEADTSSYATLMLLRGTQENSIDEYSTGLFQFIAVLAYTGTKSAAKKILEKWRSTLRAALPSYIVDQQKLVAYDPSIGGWNFTQNNVRVAVNAYPSVARKGAYMVGISIFDTHLN